MAASNSPTDVGSLLTSVMQKKDWLRRLRLHQVFLFWEEVVGHEIAQHAQPQVIKGDVLWLSVSDSVWMQHLQLESYHLLQLLNSRLSDNEKTASPDGKGTDISPRLSDLKFTLDSYLFRARRQTSSGKARVHEIDPEQFAQFSESLQSIDDQGLREAMQRVWLAMHRGAG